MKEQRGQALAQGRKGGAYRCDGVAIYLGEVAEKGRSEEHQPGLCVRAVA